MGAFPCHALLLMWGSVLTVRSKRDAGSGHGSVTYHALTSALDAMKDVDRLG